MSRRSTPSTSTADRQHSMNVSYAYGAPPHLTPTTQSRNTSARSTRARSTSARSASVDESAASSTAAAANQDTGRPDEPALVRYAKMKQRRKDTGQPFPVKNKPLPDSALRDTSVNIATAFKNATGPDDMLVPPEDVVAAAQEDAHEEGEEVSEADTSRKETHGPPQGNGKKRKKTSAADPSFDPAAHGDHTASGSDSDSHQNKKSKRDTPAEKVSSSPMRKRKSKDKTYKPTRSDNEESSEITDDGPRKRRGAGRSRETSGGNQAIITGQRDGEVWFGGKKRKGRRRPRASSGIHGLQDERDDEEYDSDLDQDDSRDGPMDDDLADNSLQAELDRTSILLRPANSPSPDGPVNDSDIMPPPASKGSNSRRTFSTILSPPRPGSRDSSGLQESSLGNSYDYAAEEQLLRTYERQQSQAKTSRQSSARNKRNTLPADKRQPFRVPTPEPDQEPNGTAFRAGRALRAVGRFLDNVPDVHKTVARSVLVALLAILAVFLLSRTRPSSSQIFAPDASPPEGVTELTERLLKLEKVMADMSRDGVSRAGFLQSDLHSLEDRVRRVERDSAESDLKALRADVRGIERGLNDVKGTVAQDKTVLQELRRQPESPIRLEQGRVILDAAVERHLKEVLAKEVVPRDLVDRKTMSEAIRREIKMLKRDFEDQANENVQKIGEELLAKYAKAEQLRSSTGSHPFARGEGGRKASASNADLDAVIDAAILRYSKDVLARPDYALFTAGARIIPSLTSPTYEAKPDSAFAKAVGWITGKSSIVGRPPATALHPDNSLGTCWPFRGSTGQLGILLSRKIVPTDVTIEHASRDVALEGDVRSAPREFELWGVVEDEEYVRKLEQYRRDASTVTDHEDAAPTSVPPTPQHILIARGSYDTTMLDPRQTFVLTREAAEVRAPLSVVVLKILSNHGDANYTCLYRVRVGGESPISTNFDKLKKYV